MSYSYLILPLQKEINNFSLFREEYIDKKKFNFTEIIKILSDFYPKIQFSDEGDGNFFSHYSISQNKSVEIWIFREKFCMSIDDFIDNVIEIANALDMSVFDVDGDQACLNGTR